MPEKKSFIKIGVIYAIGQVLGKALSFFLLPVYTRQLGSSGYGQLALVDTVLDFVGAFVICGIYSGYYRFYREYDENQRKTLKNTAINFALILAVFDILFVILFGKPISKIIFKFDNSYKILILVVIRSIIVQFVTLFMCDYTLNYQAVISVTTNLVNLVLNLTLSIFFVAYKKQGIIGVYKGYIYSNAVVLIYLVIVNCKSYRFEFDKGMLKNMLKFSNGLIPGSIASTILTLSDRYFLAGYKSYSETGVYSMGYKFGMLIEPLFIVPFKSVFTPYKFEIWKDDDAEIKFNNMFDKYNFLGLFILLGISIYSKFVISIFTTKEFINAYKIVPLILFSYFLYGKADFFSLGIQIRNKTYIDSFIMLFGGVSNIILNALFIPKYGMYGATFATVLSYIVMNFAYLKIAMPLYHVKYNFKKVSYFYSITLFLYIIYYYISIKNIKPILECIIGFILLILYVVLCLVFKLVKKETLKSYYNKFTKKINIKFNI
jgi:O-antigen/teichoic acid export membrane protein